MATDLVKCSDCKYHLNSECHRLPPVILSVNNYPATQSYFPPVTGNIRCGEGVLKE